MVASGRHVDLQEPHVATNFGKILSKYHTDHVQSLRTTQSMAVKESKSLCGCFELQTDLALSDIPEIQHPWSVESRTKSWLEERFTAGKQHNPPKGSKRYQHHQPLTNQTHPFMVSGSFICWGGSEAMHGGGFNTDGRKALQGALWIFAYFGKSRLVKYFGASEPNEREVYATVLKAFFSKSWHPKMIQQSSNVFLFKLQSAFLPDRHQSHWMKVQPENACWNFPKCRTEALPELDLFLLIPGSKGPGMVVEKRQVADPWNFPGSRILERSTFGIGIHPGILT